MAHTEHNLERLSTALDAFNRVMAAPTSPASYAQVEAQIAAENRLLDACMDMGMSFGADPVEWASERVLTWLVEA